MGYTPDDYLINVDLTGTRIEGLTVKVRDVETGVLAKMIRLSGHFDAADGDKSADAFDELLTMVADTIVEWDLEIPAGNPLPPTKEVLDKRGSKFTLPLLMAVVKVLQDVGDDLKKDSPSGPPSPVGSLPMAPL